MPLIIRPFENTWWHTCMMAAARSPLWPDLLALPHPTFLRGWEVLHSSLSLLNQGFPVLLDCMERVVDLKTSLCKQWQMFIYRSVYSFQMGWHNATSICEVLSLSPDQDTGQSAITSNNFVSLSSFIFTRSSHPILSSTLPLWQIYNASLNK